jgi:hypothetical protein
MTNGRSVSKAFNLELDRSPNVGLDRRKVLRLVGFTTVGLMFGLSRLRVTLKPAVGAAGNSAKAENLQVDTQPETSTDPLHYTIGRHHCEIDGPRVTLDDEHFVFSTSDTNDEVFPKLTIIFARWWWEEGLSSDERNALNECISEVERRFDWFGAA